MTLPTPAEALRRWPENEYPPDTLGGARRDIILKAWELVLEFDYAAGSPLTESFIDAFLTELAEMDSRLDQMIGGTS